LNKKPKGFCIKSPGLFFIDVPLEKPTKEKRRIDEK
jgi:hypothetical protein